MTAGTLPLSERHGWAPVMGIAQRARHTRRQVAIPGAVPTDAHRHRHANLTLCMALASSPTQPRSDWRNERRSLRRCGGTAKPDADFHAHN